MFFTRKIPLDTGSSAFWAGILQGGFRVQVRGNFHIGLLTSKRKKPLKGGLTPLPPPPLDPPLDRQRLSYADRVNVQGRSHGGGEGGLSPPGKI